MDLGLKGKVAIVAASSKGMGRATAMGLAAEGARVTMLARGEAELVRAAEEIRGRCQAEVLAVPADVTMIVFLASDRARYVTGVTVQVDGGVVRSIM